MNQSLKVVQEKRRLQQGFTSKQRKIQVQTTKDGTMLSPFKFYFGDDTYLSKLKANWIQC
jgi:hypothetical protein